MVIISNFILFYALSVLVTYSFIQIISERVLDEIERLGYPLDEQSDDYENPGISLADIIVFIPFLNLGYVIFGCIRSKQIIKESVKQILGEDDNDNTDNKNTKQ